MARLLRTVLTELLYDYVCTCFVSLSEYFSAWCVSTIGRSYPLGKRVGWRAKLCGQEECMFENECSVEDGVAIRFDLVESRLYGN